MSRGKLRRYYRHGLLQQLLVFEAVARLGQVTRAADDLHLAQPTVSLQLKKLSESLGITLFEQQGRCLRLTAAGAALRETCEELIECLGRAEDRLSTWREPITEKLLLAAEPETMPIASRLIDAFCARHPCVRATLHVAEREELLARLADETDDVYLFALDVDGLPDDRRFTVAHGKRRDVAQAATNFMREALSITTVSGISS